MNRNPVVSTSLESVGYDPESLTLEIEFKSGEIYDYFDVPFDVYQGLIHSESHGRYFQENIRDTYRFSRLTH